MGFVFIDLTPPVHPTVLALAWAQVVIYAIGLAVIVWQLWQMQKYGQQREREIDALAVRLRESYPALDESRQRWGSALDESTRRLGEVLAETTQRRAARQPGEAAPKI